jgi:hypothetical protein
MRKRLLLIVAVCSAFMLGLDLQALAAPAGPSRSSDLAGRVSLLERKLAAQVSVNQAQTKFNRSQVAINTLNSSRLASLEAKPTPSLQTSVQVAFGTSDSNGGAQATVFCPGGAKAVGGGAAFVGQAYYADHLLWSHASIDGSSWTASGDGLTGAGRSFETYAVCASLN